jgi:nitroimidazol reductase NimA-like FMN-containing flavoprotein (pyridoxamine 5'-phosphate oxidase superfamily)
MQINRIKRDIGEMLNSQQLGVLATYGSEYPYTTIVGFAATDDLKRILFATFRDTRKYGNIQTDPHVSILMDSRSNSAEDFSSAQALTVLGTVAEVCKDEEHDFMSLYLQKYPNLREFISDPNCALMEIKVDKYMLVSRFQEVMELDMS